METALYFLPPYTSWHISLRLESSTTLRSQQRDVKQLEAAGWFIVLTFCRCIYAKVFFFLIYYFFILVKQKCCVSGSRIPDLTVCFPCRTMEQSFNLLLMWVKSQPNVTCCKCFFPLLFTRCSQQRHWHNLHMSSFRLRHMCPQNIKLQLLSEEFDFIARELLLHPKSFHLGSFVCVFISSVLQSWPLLRC